MDQGSTSKFLIAGIGASAGGLEALEQFFRHMPADAGIAFVVVQHLAPDHESALPQLLSKYTSMPVQQVQDGTQVVPDHVYIIPPNATLTIEAGMLRLTLPAEPRGRRTPIDSLFTSLAEDRGENAVCIVLSGTGTDGTRGLMAIKEHGGMAMAQTIESARYDAILRSAIATGLVDHVLPVAEMPAKLTEYAAHLSLLDGKAGTIREQIAAQLGLLHGLLRRRTGHDFSQYKEGTIARRLERRMKALQVETVKQYLRMLERQPEEASHLFKDLLIGVTQFFRDPEAFEALGREVIPKLFQGKDEGGQVRVCVVGCASGEEAYSIAILLCEHAFTLKSAPKIQIFATDIDERGLETARKGRYPQGIAEHVSPDRLERFFIKQDGAYQVNRELRDMCVFSTHSFIKDPPFSRLDLISCRNVMIYLGLDLQAKMIPLFHYAVRPGGYLFLGPSENVTAQRELFRTVDKKHRIFQRREGLPSSVARFPLAGTSRPNLPQGTPPAAPERDLPKHLERIILQRYRPVCVAVKENGDAIYFSGRVGLYLEQPAGSPDINVLNMAREGLRIPLRTALHKAVTSREKAVQERISLHTNGGTESFVDLTVEPLAELQSANLYMVVLEESAPVPASEPGAGPPVQAGSEDVIRHLEAELRVAQERAQTTIEELETSNEELQSTNEEFQSTNEELETSREELQSFNEELETVNAELNRKVAELDHANSDLQNLLDSTQIATVFLTAELRIKNFTPTAGSVFRLIAGDIGRPITDLAPQFAEDGLVEDIKGVLRTLERCERHLTAPPGRHYQMRILPYRTVHNVIDGVVLTFTDITELKEAELRALDAKTYAENIVAAVREPLLVLNADLRVMSANKSFYQMFAASESETAGRNFYDLGDRGWDRAELRALLNDVLPQTKSINDFQMEYDVPGAGRKMLQLSARQIQQQNGGAPLILLAIEDMTQSRAALLRLNADLKHIAYATSHDLQEPLRMVVSYTQLLAKRYKGKLDAQADKFIAYAVEGALRMETLLKDLREYWSVNQQGVEAKVPVDCERVFEKTLDTLRRQIHQSGALITHEPLPGVMADEVPLALLLQNLIGNAIKYRRPDEPPLIHLRSVRKDSLWHFTLADNGIGIEPKYLEAIFAPFKRLHGLEEYPGSGLGLAICQKIVEGLGGQIWAESSKGRGSTFHFTIPAADGAA